MNKDEILVVTSEITESTRGGPKQAKALKVEELTVNVNLFIEQIGSILKNTPEKLGKFHFEELEVHAEITGKGTIALFGTGGELGAAGGLKFTFRRSPVEDTE